MCVAVKPSVRVEDEYGQRKNSSAMGSSLFHEFTLLIQQHIVVYILARFRSILQFFNIQLLVHIQIIYFFKIRPTNYLLYRSRINKK